MRPTVHPAKHLALGKDILPYLNLRALLLKTSLFSQTMQEPFQKADSWVAVDAGGVCLVCQLQV